jgi:hypothetical protein
MRGIEDPKAFMATVRKMIKSTHKYRGVFVAPDKELTLKVEAMLKGGW